MLKSDYAKLIATNASVIYAANLLLEPKEAVEAAQAIAKLAGIQVEEEVNNYQGGYYQRFPFIEPRPSDVMVTMDTDAPVTNGREPLSVDATCLKTKPMIVPKSPEQLLAELPKYLTREIDAGKLPTEVIPAWLSQALASVIAWSAEQAKPDVDALSNLSEPLASLRASMLEGAVEAYHSALLQLAEEIKK